MLKKIRNLFIPHMHQKILLNKPFVKTNKTSSDSQSKFYQVQGYFVYNILFSTYLYLLEANMIIWKLPHKGITSK